MVERYRRPTSVSLLRSIYEYFDLGACDKIYKNGDGVAVLHRAEFRRLESRTRNWFAGARWTPWIPRTELLGRLEAIQARILERRTDPLPGEGAAPAAGCAERDSVALQFEMSAVCEGLHDQVTASLYERGKGRRRQRQRRNLNHLFCRKRTRVGAESCFGSDMLGVDIGFDEVDALGI